MRFVHALKIGFVSFTLSFYINSCGTVDDAAFANKSMFQNKGNGEGKNKQQKQAHNSSVILDSFPLYELNEQQKEDITFMWQEEKLARDVYLAMNTLYNVKIFANIAKAEEKHMNAIATLLSRYNIAKPMLDDKPGEFANAELQKLYNTLIAQGKISLIDALKVGKNIEVLDIADLDSRIANAHPDAQAIYQNLKEASERHLTAFEKWMN